MTTSPTHHRPSPVEQATRLPCANAPRSANSPIAPASPRKTENGKRKTLLLALALLLAPASQAATFTVTTATDTGAGSLRQALTDAAAAPGADTITFAPALSGQTIPADILVLAGSANTSAFVIEDTDGVTIDALDLPAGFTITKHNAADACRLFYIKPAGKLTLKGLTLANAGGALPGSTDTTIPGGCIFNAGTLDLERCTLNGNVGNTGGALYTGGTATLSQCTLTANIGDTGAGIYNAGALRVSFCTIAENDAESVGGGIYANQPMTLEGSILAGNTGSEGADLYNPAVVTRDGTNLVEFASSPYNYAGVGAFIAAPALLAPLDNYGGPTKTMPPLPNSPAVDQAVPTAPTPLTIDQRGYPRPLGPRPDLGAVEGRVVIVTTTTDELDPPGQPGTGYSLREAIRDVAAGGTITFDRGLFAGPDAAANTLLLTLGPLNAQKSCTLDGKINPGGITILHQLAITTQPQPLTVGASAPASFSITATAISGGLAYQWRKNDTTILASTAASHSIASAVEADEGAYDVLLSEAPAPGTLTLQNVALTPASATSQPASLIVDTSPIVPQRQPVSNMLAIGDSHTLSVIAVGPATPPVTYQWKKNGKAIRGAKKSTYLIKKAALANAGAYTCVMKSGLSIVTSTTAEIGVVDARPKIANLVIGKAFATKAIAAGNGLTFAWKKNGMAIPGQTAKPFQIKPLTVADEALYTCAITGLAGTYADAKPTTVRVAEVAPQLVLPLAPVAANIGQSYFYQIPTIPTPGALATSYSITGMPSGLKLNATTGLITGRPLITNPNGFPLIVKAKNAKGSTAPASVTLMVNAMPKGTIGSFIGPMARSPLNDNLGGRFDLTTTASGFFSGSIVIGARRIAFTNKLLVSSGATDMILSGALTGITMADKTPLTAYIEVYAAEQYARLTLVRASDGLSLVTDAWRNPWVALSNPALYKAAFDFEAYYTIRLDAGIGGLASPSGFGFASFSLGKFGQIALIGKLPDGSVITGSSFVGNKGEMIVHHLLYKGKGSYVGQLTLLTGATVSANSVLGSPTWLKLPGLPKSKDPLYKAGFGPLTVEVEGSPYTAPTAGQRVLALPAAIAPATNANLAFSEGTIAGMADFQQPLRIDNPKPTGLTNKAFVAPFDLKAALNPNPNKVALPKLDAAKGSFSGSYTLPGTHPITGKPLNRLAPFFGQIVKIGASTQGYGFFLLPTLPAPAPAIPAKLSGVVELLP